MHKPLFKSIFKNKKPIIAMLHVFEGQENQQIAQALEDLKRLQQYVDGVIVENYGCGYFDNNRATGRMEVTLFNIVTSVIQNADIPVGLNVLPNDYAKAFRIANAAGAQFVQLDHVTGEFMECESVDPEDLLKTRDRYPNIALLGGIHPKYYVPVNPDNPITESALNAMPLCDAIVVTGEYTGGAASLEDLVLVKHAIKEHPLLVGSGLSAQNAKDQLFVADGAIVGTSTKVRGVRPGEPVDEEMVKNLMKEVSELR